VAPFLPRLASRWGSRKLIAGSLLATALLLPTFVFVPSVWFWFPLRLGLGIAAEVLLVLSETWANQMSNATSRGRTMAIYTAALSVGYAGGPAILSAVGPGKLAFFIGAALAAFAILPLLHPRVQAPAKVEAHAGSMRRVLALAPLAMTVALVNAAVETAGLTFVPMYATGIGYSPQLALRLITTLMVGAIVLQLPIGYLADKVNSRRLMLALALVTTASALLWPFLLTHTVVAFATVFLWGGLFVGIYTVALTDLGKRFQGAELIGIYSMMSVAWGVGALVGPSLVGAAMTVSSRFGLPVAIAFGCALLSLSVFRQPERPDHVLVSQRSKSLRS
jgi:MFS family permease